ncbi:uncharacterized protein LOC143228353 [Tachypleus tridentatus]|uniref:uncharacterized protein LOC143228353 n=1 Tax=Tachypleus tridentatus TaxID=6853 RepID=UPI003FD31972
MELVHLSSLFKPYILKNVENLTALHFKPDAIVQFHFFGQKDDDEGIKRIVEGVLRKGQIGRYGVDRNYVQFQQEPSLSILNVEASQKMPVVEGAEISLRCIILGSNNIKVRWFKDRYPINIDQENRTWTTIIPQASKHHYTAILKISKVHHLDSGTFTCKATNWGIVREQKLEIEVISSPEISIFPLSLTIKEGDKAVITCLSKDISSRKVGYSWLKDGRILNPSKQPEHIEDIFPTGSRLIVHTVKKSAIYSCILTNFAGMTRADSSVMVLDKTRNIPTCLPEEYQDFEWNLTLANSDHIKYCGGGYKGIVRRHCSLRAKAAASWEEPDFSNCLSEEFLKIDKEFEKLKLGYLENNVSTIIATLRNFLETRIKMMHYREGAPIVDLLQKIDSYQQHYFVNHKQVMDTAEALLDIASFLLINSYIIHKQSYVIQLHQLILNHGFLRGSFSTPGTFQVFDRPAFVLQTGRVTKDGQHNLKFPDFPENLKDSSITTFERDKMQADNQRISSKHPWLTDELEVSYNTFLMSDFDHLNDSIVTTVVFYKNLSVFLPPRFLIRKGDHDIETQLCSSMMAVILKSRQQMTGFQLNDVKVKLSLKSKISIKIGVQNVSCAVVSFAEGKFKFHLDGCQQTQEGSYIVCICNQTGLFAALATVVNSARHTHGRFDVIVGIGCALCICLVLVTVLILLVFWRRIKGP